MESLNEETNYRGSGDGNGGSPAKKGYRIEYLQPANINKIEAEWHSLTEGDEMTYFQSFEWYKMLFEINQVFDNNNFSVRIVVVSDNLSNVVMIAPLWIVTKTFAKFNKKGAYIFGGNQWSDYLNLIYKRFEPTAFEALLASVKEKYHITQFYFEELPGTTSLYHYLSDNYHIGAARKTDCVELTLPESTEAYHKLLSKSSRQNIRTAGNRAERDNIIFSINYDDKEIDRDFYAQLRSSRLDTKRLNYSLKQNLIFFISQKILRRGKYTFAPYSPFYDDKNAKFLTVRDANGVLCAAFCYGIDATNRIAVMSACTNPDFYKYSPGILGMYDFINHLIEHTEIKSVDFTRGTERYKYALGGKEHYNFSFSIDIK